MNRPGPNDTSADADQAFLSPRDVARLIGVEPSTLAAWRRRGVGPPWYRIEGHLVRYDRTRVIAWVERQASNAQPESPEGA